MARTITPRHGKGTARRFTAFAAMGALIAPLLLVSSDHREPDTVMAPGVDDAAGPVRQIAPDRQLGASGELPQAAPLSPDIAAVVGHGSMTVATVLPLAVPSGPMGIPGVVLDAYRKAAATIAASDPHCGLHWSVLAGIGRIESDHARGGQVYPNGDTVGTILGPRLDGTNGTAAVPALDDGRFTGDPIWDHAVGPMQFIASTWAIYGGTGNPNNVYDAALAAGRYLCAGGADLRDPAQLAAAVFRYNHSNTYVATVLLWAQAYAAGVTPLPTPIPPQVPPPLPAPSAPVVNTAPPPLGGHSTSPANPKQSPDGSISPTTTTPSQTMTTPPAATTAAPSPTTTLPPTTTTSLAALTTTPGPATPTTPPVSGSTSPDPTTAASTTGS